MRLHLPRARTRARTRTRIATALAAVLVVAGTQAASSAAAWAAGGGAGASPVGPVSNAFAMGGGIGGQIDQRTGAFQASVPLLNISGRGGSNLSISLSYDQNLAAQGAAGNRFGFGAGWAIGLPWVNTAGTVRVYAAAGGSFLYDTGSPTGLHEYPLRDLSFAKASGPLPGRPGIAQPRSYTYTLKHYDGTTDYFDATGNLLEQADRFGNLIDLTWQQSGQSWQPTAVIDNYGAVTTFDYGAAGQVQVSAPDNAEGITATNTFTVEAGLLRTITDASGASTSFTYVTVGALSSQLLRGISAPNGARTTVNYAALTYEPNVVVVTNVQVTDGSGTAVETTRTFNADPTGNQAHHNFTGYPTYNKAGTDGLFDSNDRNYLYSTALSDGRSTVIETYTSLHLLKSRAIRVADPVRGTVLQQVQTYSYPPVATVASLPANYAKPTAVTVVYGDPTYTATRTVTSSSSYDDRGELLRSTDENNTVTATTYDPTFGVPSSETTTGADGTTSLTTNTLTSDGSAVKTSSTAVGTTSGQTPTARSVTTYSYDNSGEVTGRSVTWAPGAKPSGPSVGPDQIDTTRTITVDTAARTRTAIDTQAAGTSDAASTTTVTDLITGNVLSTTNPDQLTTTYTYDALGRVTSQTDPGERTTTTSYPSPLITDVTDPTGHTTQTTSDVLGRTVKVTDNVVGTASGLALVSDPTARTLSVHTYSADGSTATSTPTTGATTTTNYDPLQRPIKIVKPDGLTQTIAYDDVAHTKTTLIIPIGAQTPSAATVERYDNLARTIGSATAYQDNTPQTPSTQNYDGLGRVAAATANNVAATANYTGAGGVQDGATLTPTDTGTYPGGTEVAATSNTLTGALSTKTLTDNAATGTTSTSGATLTYDAAGRVATATDPSGGTTSYTYTLAGKTKTVTSPTGTVTTDTYSPSTGQLVEKDLRGAGGSTQKTAYTYYADSGLVESMYDPDQPSDVITYQYDPDGRTTAVHYPDGTASTASYALNGELASATDVTGALTTYQYDPTGVLTGATQTRAGAQIATVSYTYDSLDRVHTIGRGNGGTTTITYSDANQITNETTTTTGGTIVRADAYTYDTHANTSTHTSTSGSTISTVRYSYDAYDRLTSSATYPNATGTGTPTSAASYVLNAGGDVTRLTATANGATTTTVNTITAGDQLTAQTVNGAATTTQTYNPDGTVKHDLNGTSYQYNLADQPASVTTAQGTTTSYAYWPDGTRRSASTTVNGVVSTTTLHYDTTGRAANDTYTDSTTGSTPQTASYLFGVHRESRSVTTSSAVGAPPPPPPCTKARHAKCPSPKPPCRKKHPRPSPGTGSGPVGVGADAPATHYYLADGHGSMVSMTDASGVVSASYGYGDYGQPVGGGVAALPGRRLTTAADAAVNPFTYNGGYTDPSTGTLILPARAYDPSQGRFLSLDSTNMLNRYQAFDTNPIDNTDPTGHAAVPDIVTDVVAAALFLAFFVLAAIPVFDVVVGAAAISELSTAATVAFATNVGTAATNLGAFATSTTLTADDAVKLGGKTFLSDTQRQNLETANFALGTAAGAFGVGAGGAGIKVGREVEAELSTTQETLATTEQTLGTTRQNLGTTQQTLQDTQSIQEAQQKSLINRGVELGTTKNQLTTAQSDLAATRAALNESNGQRDTALDQLSTAQKSLANTKEELATTQKSLEETVKQVASFSTRLAVPASEAERAIAQSDPNATPEPVPIAANQVSSNPIQAVRGDNLSLGSGFGATGFGNPAGW